MISVLQFEKMSANVQKPSCSEAVISDYMSPIKIFGHAKIEIGGIFSEISDYIGDSIGLLSGLYCYLLYLILAE